MNKLGKWSVGRWPVNNPSCQLHQGILGELRRGSYHRVGTMLDHDQATGEIIKEVLSVNRIDEDGGARESSAETENDPERCTVLISSCIPPGEAKHGKEEAEGNDKGEKALVGKSSDPSHVCKLLG